MQTLPDDRSQVRRESPAPGDASRSTGAGRAFAIIGSIVLTAAALKLGRTVLVPIVAGLFLAVLARPIHRRLGAALPRGLRWLGLVAAMLTIIAGIAVFGAAIGWSGRAVAEEFRTRRSEIESRLATLRPRAARLGIDIPQLPGGEGGGGASSSSGGASPPAQGAGAPQGGARGGSEGGSEGGSGGGGGGGTASRAFRGIATGLAEMLLALAFAALALAEADEARRRIARLGNGRGGQRALAAIDEMTPTFRRYVWVKSLTSLITGTATALIALAFGLPLAWVWGFIAFLLEYVPTVGSLLAVGPPVLMALAEGGPGKAGLVFLCIGTAQVILGNVVDPKLEGRLMAVSPFGVLLSIVVWGWLWGAVGALLAVPLTVAFVIASRHITGMHGVATVVAGDGVPDDEDEGASRQRGA